MTSDEQLQSKQNSLHVASKLLLSKFSYLTGREMYVLYGSQNKQQLFPYTELTDWFLQLRSVFTARYGLYL